MCRNLKTRIGTFTQDTVYGRRYILYDVIYVAQSVGVTATLPHWVPDVLPTTEAGSDEWYYDGNRLYHNRSSTEFPNIPPLHNVSTCQKVGLQISTNGQLHLFIDEQHMECIATGLPVNKPLWGAVNVFGDCTKIKSEMLSGKSDIYVHFVFN